MTNLKQVFFLSRNVTYMVCVIVAALSSRVAEANSVAVARPIKIFTSYLADVIVRVETIKKSELDCLILEYDAANRRYVKSLEFPIASKWIPSHGVVNVQAGRLFLAWEKDINPTDVAARIYSLDGKIISEIKLCDILTPKQLDVFVSDRKKIGSDLIWMKSMLSDLDGNAVIETSVGVGKTLINRDVTIHPNGTVVGAEPSK